MGDEEATARAAAGCDTVIRVPEGGDVSGWCTHPEPAGKDRDRPVGCTCGARLLISGPGRDPREHRPGRLLPDGLQPPVGEWLQPTAGRPSVLLRRRVECQGVVPPGLVVSTGVSLQSGERATLPDSERYWPIISGNSKVKPRIRRRFG